MAQVLEIATRISTPLALAGFIAAVLFLLFRQILSLDIFPKLTKALSENLLLLLINRLFALSITAMVLGFMGFALSILLPILGPRAAKADATVSDPTPVPNSNSSGPPSSPPPVTPFPLPHPSEAASPALKATDSPRRLTRENSAAEVLAVLAQAPSWDRKRIFENLFKERWPKPPGGWAGSVEGEVRGTADSCEFLVVELNTRARILAQAERDACDVVRSFDRVRVDGPIVGFDTDLLTLDCRAFLVL
jgi:hypothetical protein